MREVAEMKSELQLPVLSSFFNLPLNAFRMLESPIMVSFDMLEQRR